MPNLNYQVHAYGPSERSKQAAEDCTSRDYLFEISVAAIQGPIHLQPDDNNEDYEVINTADHTIKIRRKFLIQGA